MSSTKQLYKRFVHLCQKWPLDKEKTGRDLGQFIRDHFSSQFPHGELSSLKNAASTEAQLQALENIASNKYYNVTKFNDSTASSIRPGDCDSVLSNESLQIAKDFNEESVLTKLKVFLSTPHLEKKSS